MDDALPTVALQWHTPGRTVGRVAALEHGHPQPRARRGGRGGEARDARADDREAVVPADTPYLRERVDQVERANLLRIDGDVAREAP
jgi:hypothetical protein